MSIRQEFYLAASINQAMGHREAEVVLRDFSGEHPENQRLRQYIDNGMRPGAPLA